MCKYIFEYIIHYLKYYDISKCSKIISRTYSSKIMSEMEYISFIFKSKIAYNLEILNLIFIEIIDLSLIYFERFSILFIYIL